MMYTINVTNNSLSNQNIFFFQQPAAYTGGQAVYSNSLYSSMLAPNASSGAVLTFLLMQNYYAAVQQQFQPPALGQPSGYSSAIQPISLTPQTGSATNSTNMTVQPSLALSIPTANTAVQPGAFRIVTSTYNPTLSNYNGGSGVKTATGGVVLSSFVTLQPNQNLDCQPILKFYVQTGSYAAGTVMNFSSSSVGAALCDATTGFTTFNVTYNVDGTWTITPSASLSTMNLAIE